MDDVYMKETKPLQIVLKLIFYPNMKIYLTSQLYIYKFLLTI